jgi:hypothetical protein
VARGRRTHSSKKKRIMTAGTELFYETDNGIFKFTVEDVMDHLNRNETQYDAKEVTVLEDLLSSPKNRLWPCPTFEKFRHGQFEDESPCDCANAPQRFLDQLPFPPRRFRFSSPPFSFLLGKQRFRCQRFNELRSPLPFSGASLS